MNPFQGFFAQQETQPLAICLTETWLKDDSNIKCLSLSSYRLLDTSNRQIGKGGGVAIFVSEGVVKTVLQKFSSGNCQLPTIKIESENYEKNIVLTVETLSKIHATENLIQAYQSCQKLLRNVLKK